MRIAPQYRYCPGRQRPFSLGADHQQNRPGKKVRWAKQIVWVGKGGRGFLGGCSTTHRYASSSASYFSLAKAPSKVLECNSPVPGRYTSLSHHTGLPGDSGAAHHRESQTRSGSSDKTLRKWVHRIRLRLTFPGILRSHPYFSKFNSPLTFARSVSLW
jgi:hypothetical protein